MSAARALGAVLLAALAAAPRAASADGDPSSGVPGWVHGAARYRFFGYFDEGRQENDLYRNQGEVDLELTPALPGLPLRAEVLLHTVYDDEQLSHGAFDDRSAQRPAFGAREAFIAWEPGAFEVRAGKQIYSWGKGDLHSPTDLLNAREYADPFEAEDPKIGAWSLHGRALVADLAIETVWVPGHFVPTRLPPRGERFDFVPPDAPLPLLPRDLPPDTLEASQYAGRISGTIDPASLDWGISVYEGRDHEPNVRPKVVPTPAPPFRAAGLEPYHKRETVVGASLSHALWKLELHGESAYFFHSEHAEDEYFETVLGLNIRESGLLDDSDEAFLVAEYAFQTETVEALPGVIPSQFSRLFERALLGRGRYSWGGGELVVEATAVLIFEEERSQYYQAKASYRLTDWAKVTAGTDLFLGSEESFFGQFRDDDRVFLSVETSF